MSAPPAPREAICTRSYLCLADRLSDLCSGTFDQLFSLQAAGDDIGAADRGHRSFPQGINHISLYAVFESISLTFHRKLASLFHKIKVYLHCCVAFSLCHILMDNNLFDEQMQHLPVKFLNVCILPNQ